MDKLRMGAAQEIITPKVGGHLAGYGNSIFSTCVNDDLTVSAYYFEQGGQKALMISACVCAIRVWLSRHIRERIAKEHNIPIDHITISCIHTHSGPATFGGYFEQWEGDMWLVLPYIDDALPDLPMMQSPQQCGSVSGLTSRGVDEVGFPRE